MTILTVTSAGDVTLDKELLETLDIAPGDRLVVLPRADGGLSLSPVPEVTAAPQKKKEGGLEAFFGSLKNKTRVAPSLEEIKEAIEDGWAGKVRFDDDR
ncbi:AbrB/MazE/SpoVT family DNA-binding domain-containing protein [Rhizobium panacihumi]|uniref:AbrB/MazE/SpoVT family DNA-binding domain-containing protein n=1 Tax=Rhizobium panacihumi TaxID=2008450 RepID=UPI003D7A1ADB